MDRQPLFSLNLMIWGFLVSICVLLVQSDSAPSRRPPPRLSPPPRPRLKSLPPPPSPLRPPQLPKSLHSPPPAPKKNNTVKSPSHKGSRPQSLPPHHNNKISAEIPHSPPAHNNNKIPEIPRSPPSLHNNKIPPSLHNNKIPVIADPHMHRARRIGFWFAGTAAALQVPVIGFLVYKRWEISQIKDRHENGS